MNNNVNQQLVIYPNPVTDILHIDTAEPALQLEVFDLSGNKVMAIPEPEEDIVLDVSALPQGFYLIRIMGGDQLLRGMFAKR